MGEEIVVLSLAPIPIDSLKWILLRLVQVAFQIPKCSDFQGSALGDGQIADVKFGRGGEGGGAGGYLGIKDAYLIEIDVLVVLRHELNHDLSSSSATKRVLNIDWELEVKLVCG